MTTCPRFRPLPVIAALVALSVVAAVPLAQAVPLAEAAPASGGTVSQSGDCPGGSQQDEHCVPGGPGSHPAGPGGPIHPPITPPVVPPAMPPSGRPRVTQPEDFYTIPFILGHAKATLHIHDDDHDVIYTSGLVPLLFIRRAVQRMTGNTQYVLAVDRGRSSMTWNVNGRVFDCIVEGTAIIPFPTERINADVDTAPGQYTPLDPTRPVFGYMNVVGPEGGDFHSVIIQMFDPDARLTKTCPGNPPLVTKEKFDAGFLLHILWAKNTHEDGRVTFKGEQTYDQGNPLDFLNLLPPGAAIPEDARRALEAAGSGTSLRYTWEWELIPVPPAQ